MRRFTCLGTLSLIALVIGGPSATAAELLGAKAVLEQAAQPQPPAKSEETTEQDDLASAIEAFPEERDRLPPDEAAGAWLALVDRWIESRAEGDGGAYGPAAMYGQTQAIPFSALVEAIPGPDAWPALEQAIAARSGKDNATVNDHALSVLAQFLVGRSDAMVERVEAILTSLEGFDPWEAQQVRHEIQNLAEVLGSVRDDPEQMIESLQQQIRAAQAGGNVYSIEVPDLVTLVGRERAAELLREALVLPVEGIQIEVGDETRALARELALELADALTRPRWGLVDTLDSVALYEAMAARFLPKPVEPGATDESEAEDAAAPADAGEAADGDAAPNGIMAGLQRLIRDFDMGDDASDAFGTLDSWEYRQARVYYVLGLIAAGRTDDAAAEVRRAAKQSDSLNLPYGAMEALDAAGFTGRVYAFLHTLLGENPDLPLWNTYRSVAVRSGHADEMVQLARDAAAREGLSPRQRAAILRELAYVLLAADHVDEGVAALQQIIDTAPRNNEAGINAAGEATKIARIGLLLDRPEWIEAGTAKAQEAMAARRQASWSYSYTRDELVEVLRETGRHAEAEALLADALAAAIRQDRLQAPPAYYQYYDDNSATADALKALVLLYDEFGRYQDVITLLDEAPYWGKNDLHEVLTADNGDGRLGAAAARALAEAGRRDDALRVVDDVLWINPGHDPAYAVLVDLLGQAAIPKLDELFARDPFEERPLIWKAKLQLDAGDAEAALTTIRRAIAIDPSDGEQGRGDRMRAYSVLADALEALGQADEASIYRGAVSAIRIAEDADRLYAAGLITRGVELYEAALTHFADAYCIQSRLAVQLSGMGRHEEAAEHFRKAYELMPDSFGRMESHCFGCEGVFEGEQAQTIAEEVFGRLIRQTPEKPQVHYLYGYLLSAKEQYREAVPHFERAVELDPDYLSAWESLQAAARHVHLSIEKRDRATLNLLRLDPLGRHTYPSVSTVWDVATMWPMVEAGAERVGEPPEAAYELKASAAALEEKAQAAEESGALPADLQMSWRPDFASDHQGPRTPGEVLAQHHVVQAVAAVMER